MVIRSYDDFLKRLVRVPVLWRLNEQGQVRVLDDACCPLCAVANSEMSDRPDEHETLAASAACAFAGIKISRRLINRITGAADRYYSRMGDPADYDRLLIACGLKEDA